MLTISDIVGTIFINSTFTAMARVLDWLGNPLTIENTTSINYTITDPNGDAVSGHTAVSLTPSAVLYDTLQTPSFWTADTIGYNFAHTIDVAALGPAFTVGGLYSLVYTCWRRPDIGPLRRPGRHLAGGSWRRPTAGEVAGGWGGN